MFDPIATYCEQRRISVIRSLGCGREGNIYETTHPSAIKVHREKSGYLRERDAYLRLLDRQITQVRGLRIPTLFDHDEKCQILEMSIVRPPFLLDFGSAWLDEAPDFSEEVLLQWHDEIRGRFGDRFAEVMSVLTILARTAGIYLLDVHPNNIKFDNPSITSK